MEIRTHRARSIAEARRLIEQELGSDSAVVENVHDGETRDSNVEAPAEPDTSGPHFAEHPIGFADEYRTRLKRYLKQDDDPACDLEDLCEEAQSRPAVQSDALFRVFADLLDAEFSESTARTLTERLRAIANDAEMQSPALLSKRLVQIVQDVVQVRGPICVTPGQCRVVALIGPTGVGKTTTIAKLAANFRLRDKLRVGLITVDTYRIAAVEQLRTYADIIDLPMEVVATPREMREAVARFANLDVVLIDTAGRSPKDDVQLQELKALLGEARPAEVHLVLSSVSNAASLTKAAKQFETVGANTLLLTKLDEAVGLGSLLPLFENSRLPVSYMTNGQNVPNDIQAVEREQLVDWMVGSVGVAKSSRAV